MDKQATSLVNTNGALDPFLKTALQQNYRSGEAARGMAGGAGDAAMEGYYQAATQEQRRLQNLSLAGSVAGQEANYYGDPFAQILQRTSGRGTLPQPAFSANQPDSIQQVGASINPAAFSLANTGYNAQQNAKMAGYNSQMQGLGMIGSSIGGLGQGISGISGYFNSPSSGSTAPMGLGGMAG